MVISCPHCGAQLALGAIACFRCGRMVASSDGGGTGQSHVELPTELQTLAKAGLLEGQWRLLAPLGQGKTGVVWEAHDVALDRRVAVKLLHEQLQTRSEQVQRFEREGRVLAKLDHPNLTPVLGSGRFEGRPFLVMRLLTGRTLAELVHARGDKLGLAEASFCLVPVCDGLQALHDAGVVHRDLKPSNVFIGDDGRVTLLDLGQAFEVGSELTKAGELIGTAEYLSPEQLTGRIAGAKSDVYALGCLMHELFTGRPPFHGTASQVFQGHLHGARPAPGELPMPEALAQMTVKMLAVDPVERPELSALRSLLEPYAAKGLVLPAAREADTAPTPTPTTDPREVVTQPTPTPVSDPRHERERPTAEAAAEPAAPLGGELSTRPLEPEATVLQPTLQPLTILSDDSPLLAEATRVARAPLAPEQTVVREALQGVREQTTRPTRAQPLPPFVTRSLAVLAAVLVLVVGVAVLQPTPQPPVPRRVDQPGVETSVKVTPPASNAPPGPPAMLMVDLAEAPVAVPHLTEKKELVNAAPVTATAPKRGRPPNRAPVKKGFIRVVASVFGDEVSCRLFIDGVLVGRTPYWSGILRPGEHSMRAECPNWPPHVEVWPIPPVPLQKLGELVELVIAGDGADQPMGDVTARRGYLAPCPTGASQCRR